MTATHGVGSYGNAVGTVTPLDHKMAQLGLIMKTAANTVRGGVFWDGNATIVSGKANMSYDVRALSAVLTRGASAGAVLLTNDAVYNVLTTAAPGSNSRYDVVYLWQREYSLDGTDSNPVIGVVQGTPAASPTVPSLAAFPGAIALAQILVPAGVTATNTGTTITQTSPFTTVADGTVVVRTTTERDAYSPSAADTKARAFVIADTITYKWNGTVWKPYESDWIAYTATLTNFTIGTGGAALNSTDFKWDSGRLRVRWRLYLGTSGAGVGTQVVVTMPPGVTLRVPSNANLLMEGKVTLFQGASTNLGHIRYSASNTDRFEILANAATAGGLAIITSNSPWIWAPGNGTEGELIVDVQ